jgi:transposase InsO family protein
VWQDTAIDVASAYTQAVAALGAQHSSIRAGRPQTNGCVERVQQTILDECWKPAFARYLIPKQTGLRLDLERYLRSYNTGRADTGRWTPRPHPRGRPREGQTAAQAALMRRHNSGTRQLTKGYGSSWIFERCLTCSNALRRVQHPAFSLVTA